MQSPSSFSPNGVSMASPYLYSDLLPSYAFSRRKKRSSHGDFLGNSCILRIQIKTSERVFLSTCFIRRPSAQSLRLSHDPQASEDDNDAVNGDFLLHSPSRKQENSGREERVGFVEEERVDVRELAGRLCDVRTADDVDEVLKDHDALPLPVFSSIIRGFGFDRSIEPAFAILEWLKRKGKDQCGVLTPNLFIYNSILGALKHSEHFEKIDEVMEEMKSQGIVPNIVTYNTMMSVYIDQGNHQKALAVLNEIKRAGLSPSPATYSSALLVYRNMEDAIGAIDFFLKLREEYGKGYMANDPDYDWNPEFTKLENFAIRVCYLVMRQHLVNEEDSTTNVFKILSAMDKAQLKPGRTVYERLIWACTRRSHYTVSKELYARIREKETGISISVCNHVIWLLGKAKKWWAALEIYEDLLEKGPAPNDLSSELIISHFNLLIDAAKRKGIWRWGVKLINIMLDKGLRPGIREWNSVLVACSKASETSAAVEIFKRMVEHGEKPTVLSYGALLSALEKGELYDEALVVWDHMWKVGVKPNLHAFTILASVYAGDGKVEMVDSVFQAMKLSKIEASVVTFNAVITGFVRNRMKAAAFEWFRRMKVRNVKPNEITYEMLIAAFVEDGEGKVAYEMYLEAVEEGLQLSPKSYDAVLRSSQASGIRIDRSVLGNRPQERKKAVRIRKNLSEFCHLADVCRSSKPFDRAEICSSDT